MILMNRASLCMVTAASLGIAAAPTPDTRPPIPQPILHVTWNAPYGDPRARSSIAPVCTDTTREDTLYVGFETGSRIVRVKNISAVVLFEPQAGDSLGSFWFFERGGANEGSLIVKYDFVNGEYADSPWGVGFAYGHVGYTHDRVRGRLDISANAPPPLVKSWAPNLVFCFAQITISHRRSNLSGCGRPMSIACVGARFFTVDNREFRAATSPDQRVPWNPRRGGIPRRGARGPLVTWVPDVAPPSRALVNPIVKAASQDSGRVQR